MQKLSLGVLFYTARNGTDSMQVVDFPGLMHHCCVIPVGLPLVTSSGTKSVKITLDTTLYMQWAIPQLDKLLNSKTILAQLERAS